MGKKRKKTREKPHLVNVEIAPGNQRFLDAYIERYNGSPTRSTPRLSYADVVNDALDQFLKTRVPVQGDG
ncbi:MAG TPA: hypothetical protein VHE79_11160 [Spirochaetia bacterium]